MVPLYFTLYCEQVFTHTHTSCVCSLIDIDKSRVYSVSWSSRPLHSLHKLSSRVPQEMPCLSCSLQVRTRKLKKKHRATLQPFLFYLCRLKGDHSRCPNCIKVLMHAAYTVQLCVYCMMPSIAHYECVL